MYFLFVWYYFKMNDYTLKSVQNTFNNKKYMKDIYVKRNKKCLVPEL